MQISNGLGLHQTTNLSKRMSQRKPRRDVSCLAMETTLYDVPVSNNGGRIRCIIYKKNLEEKIAIRSPAEIGGLRSEEFTALNPYQKMPVLVLPSGEALPESQVIESYLLDKYRDQGPSLIPETPELRARAALIARIHDMYIAPIQGCMYKQMDNQEERTRQISQISDQLDMLERYCIGPYMCGDTLSYADSAVLPTLVFCNFILPRYFGWSSIFKARPRLEEWWQKVSEDPDLSRVMKEVESGLEAWVESDRWTKLGIIQS